MGLIDSTNRVERTLATAKAERQAEREQQRLERRYNAELKAERDGAKAQALEELRNIFTEVYNLLGYEQASLYFKSISAKKQVIDKISTSEMIKRSAFDNYSQVLAKVEMEQKRNWEYLQQKQQAQVPAVEVQRKEVEKEAAVAVAQLFLAVGRVFAGAIFLVFLVFLGFVKISEGVCTPTRTKRYR